VLGFYEQLHRSKPKTINTCDEQGAGFAADAYARVRGLARSGVTYCVGGLKVANTTAEPFCENRRWWSSAVQPGMKERRKPMLHHKVREFDTSGQGVQANSPSPRPCERPADGLCQEIDRVARGARYKRPVYIELPRDMAGVPGHPHYRPQELHEMATDTLRAALAEARGDGQRGEETGMLAEVEVHRFGLQAALLQLARKTNIPVAATLLGNVVASITVLSGVYEGAMGREDVRRT